MPNRIIPYNRNLKLLARKLRKQRVLSEVLLWKQLQRKSTGFEFHRQVPVDEYILDFYCHELQFAIEVDGVSHDHFDEIKMNSEIRQSRLESLGIVFLRFHDFEIKKDVSLVMNKICLKIDELTSP